MALTSLLNAVHLQSQPTNLLVSTIIPVHNRAELLPEAVESVIAQTYRLIEIVIVDDGSTDDTPKVCQQLAGRYPDIVRVAAQSNGGPGAARNTGVELANGEFIQYLDSDDLLAPRKLERQIAALKENPDCGVAYCKTRQYWKGKKPKDIASARTGEKLETLFPDLLTGRCWRTLTPLYRRDVIERVGPWTALRNEEDWEYDARLAALGIRLVWCDEFLADVRSHDGVHACEGDGNEVGKMKDRCQAHVLIHSHARRAGITSDNPHMQHFARELFLLARQCGAVGLAEESRRLFETAREASGSERSKGLDFRVYRGVTACVGWNLVGSLATWFDHIRTKTK